MKQKRWKWFGLLSIAVWALTVCFAFAAETEPPGLTEDLTLSDDARNTGIAAGDGLSAFWGKKVRKIKYDLPPWMSVKDVQRVTKLKAGKTLSRWRIRSTLRRVYLLGYVENIVIKALPAGPDEVDLEIKIYPIYVIRDIIAKDHKTFNYFEIVDELLHIATGDDFVERDIRKWKEKLTDALKEQGRLDAEVRIRFEKTKREVDNKVDIFINFDEKKQYKVNSIRLEGDLGPFSKKEILALLKWKQTLDAKYTQARFDSGVVRLRKFLKKNEFLEAQVPDWDIDDPDMVAIDHEKGKIDVTYTLNIGPRVLIDFDRKCYSCSQRKWKLPAELNLKNQRRFNRWVITDWEKRIERFFQRRGYYDAVVIGNYEETFDEKGPIKKINFSIDRGKRVKIRKVDFKNNPHFKDKELIALLQTNKHFSEEDFNKDLENVINFYNKSGFLKAKILERRLEYVPGDGIYIQIVMQEGPQTILTKIEFSETKVFDAEDFRKFFEEIPEEQRLVEGRPFNPFNVETIRTRIISQYMKKGYIKSRVPVKAKPTGDTEMILFFDITEGLKYKFGNVYIHGNKLTKDHVIRRELFIREGQPFDYERVFESEQALVQLGFFRSVQIRPVEMDIAERYVDLLVEVEERNSGYIETGVGYNTYFGYNVAFEVGHKNLAGHGRRLSFHTDAAMKDEHFRFDNRHVAIDFLWPWVARLPLDGKMTIYDNQEDEIGYDLRSQGWVFGLSTVLTKLFYNLKSTQANVDLQRLWKYWTVGTDYEIARDFIYNLEEAVDVTPGEIQITNLRPYFIRDERNNPFHPTRGVKSDVGSYLTGKINWASPALQSQVHYLQAEAQAAAYYGLFEIPDTGVFVFAQNFRIGHGQVLRETDEIPISRRFYLGGSTTIRGFAQNEIAPLADDEKTPIGGNFYLQSNTELRIPLPKSLGLLVFFDVGDVSKDFEHFYVDLMRTATGLGLRYMTPIGPISADYGFKLNRRHDESIGEFYITIGNAF